MEIALFTKTLEECVTESDRLFYIFKNSEGSRKIPERIEKSGGIPRRLAEACEVAAFDKKQRIKYKIDKINERDILAQQDFAERRNFEAGSPMERQKESQMVWPKGWPRLYIMCHNIRHHICKSLTVH